MRISHSYKLIIILPNYSSNLNIILYYIILILYLYYIYITLFLSTIEVANKILFFQSYIAKEWFTSSPNVNNFKEFGLKLIRKIELL